jgi:predicted HTH domain antitoxin
MDNVCIEIPREVLNSARMSVAELKKELALILYQQNKLSFGKARELTELNVWAFQQRFPPGQSLKNRKNIYS